MERAESPIRFKEETERGDVARSLQKLIETQFISKRFEDIMGSTRLRRVEILTFALMEINKSVMKISSLTYEDTQDRTLSIKEQEDIIELYALKKRFMRNPCALAYAVYNAFEYMYGLGLQSLDGLSRQEGVTISGGAFKRLLDPDEMSFFQKAKKRLMGDVLFTE